MTTPVRTAWIDIAPGFAGWLALPPAGQGPGLVLWQEIFGVNAHIRALAEQYALDGFTVLAPDAFWRQASRVELGYEGAERERARALMQGYAADEALADIAASVQALRARPEAAGGVGTIGYCMGGRLAYLAAATAGVDAAVAYYGGGIQGQLERAAGIACPLQFHYAGHDEHIPPDAVERVRQAVAGKVAEVQIDPPCRTLAVQRATLKGLARELLAPCAPDTRICGVSRSLFRGADVAVFAPASTHHRHWRRSNG